VTKNAKNKMPAYKGKLTDAQIKNLETYRNSRSRTLPAVESANRLYLCSVDYYTGAHRHCGGCARSHGYAWRQDSPFLAFFIFPILAGSLGYNHHMERSKQTTFCLSCHVMEPYGRSLHVDDPTWLPAAHYQNNRVPRDEACYTCHTVGAGGLLILAGIAVYLLSLVSWTNEQRSE
jgi:hypothetical protein